MKEANEYLKDALGYLPKFGDEACSVAEVDTAIEAVLSDHEEFKGKVVTGLQLLLSDCGEASFYPGLSDTDAFSTVAKNDLNAEKAQDIKNLAFQLGITL